MPHILKILLIIYTFIVLQGNAEAVTWQDEFTQETVDDWQLQGTDSVWQIDEGFLRANIETEKEWLTLFELYQFIAIPGPYDNLTITVEGIGVVNDIKFGIALGKNFLNDLGEIEEIGYYLFLTNDMEASRDGKVFLGPGKRWHSDVLNEMVINFDNGRFQFFGDGESRMDFIDANLRKIDFIGFILVDYVTDQESTGEAWVEKITITGLPVSPKEKVTTTWGHLKQE